MVKEGTCYICGQLGKLSREHMPPRKAFNDCKVILKKIDSERTKAEVKWRLEQRQGGNFGFVLCEDCNNKTGSWYGSEYVKHIKVCAQYANIRNAEGLVSIQIHDLYPIRVVKEVLAMMCASCGPTLSHENPTLRNLVLNKNSKGFPDYLKIFTYIMSNEGGRSSGVAGILNLNDGISRIVAEFSWWPVGWILTFDDNTNIAATDITHWCHFGYDEKIESIEIKLHCHWAATPYPLDFRNPEQVIRERERNEKGRI